MTLEPVSAETATITVAAQNADAEASQSFKVTVRRGRNTPPQERSRDDAGQRHGIGSRVRSPGPGRGGWSVGS